MNNRQWLKIIKMFWRNLEILSSVCYRTFVLIGIYLICNYFNTNVSLSIEILAVIYCIFPLLNFYFYELEEILRGFKDE